MTSPLSQRLPGLSYAAVANWGPRQETPDALAARWIEMIERLQAVDPIFAHWYDGYGEGPYVAFDSRPAPLAQKISDNVGTDDDGTPQPLGGYQWCMQTSPACKRGPFHFSAHMFAGKASFYDSNCVHVGTDYGLVPDSFVLTYKIFSGALLALAEAFGATRAYAYPENLSDLWPRSENWHPKLPLAWISYVAPRFAHLVKPPLAAFVERRSDGGLLMAATDETFVATNPAHMAVARDIEAAVAPFNAVPWPPEVQVV